MKTPQKHRELFNWPGRIPKDNYTLEDLIKYLALTIEPVHYSAGMSEAYYEQLRTETYESFSLDEEQRKQLQKLVDEYSFEEVLFAIDMTDYETEDRHWFEELKLNIPHAAEVMRSI